MMVSTSMDLDGVSASLDLMVANARDLRRPMAEFAAYKKADVLDDLASGRFAPLAESTLARRGSYERHAIEKAQKRAILTVGKRVFRSGTRASIKFTRDAGFSEKRLNNAIAAVNVFRHLMSISPYTGADEKTYNRVARRLFKSALKAQKRVSTAPLGQLGSSIAAKASKAGVAILSHQKGSQALNEGGTVGNNAELPERRFLAWKPTDMEMARSLLVGFIVEPLAE